ncbi:MAG: hypothetical protein GXO26_08325 [Crenarchaeota archaeon]|nr:hypothetical protein [Thermoproteota archaeon]
MGKKSSIMSVELKMFGLVSLLLAAIYGMALSMFELLTAFDYKWIILFILCFGGLVRVGYDIYYDLRSLEKPISFTPSSLAGDVIICGALLVIGIYLLYQILTTWKIPYPQNYALLADVAFMVVTIIYAMMKNLELYYIHMHRKTKTGTSSHSEHGAATKSSSIMASKYMRYWRFEDNKVLEESKER